MLLGLKKTSFFDSLETISISPDDLTIIENTSEYRDKIFELIGTAKKRIYITALYLQDDEAGQAVLTALYEAKQKKPDLDVKIFVDFLRAQRGLIGHKKSIGNIRLYREMNKKYEHSIDIYGVPVKSKEFLGVLHLKGFVFDDVLLYSGSSINDIYLQYKNRYRYDRYHVINSVYLTNAFVKFLRDNFVNCDAVCSLTSEEISTTKKLKGAIRKLKICLRKSDYFFKSNENINSGENVKLTPLLGFGGRKNKLNQTIHQLVVTTEKQVVIFTPYFNFPAKIYKALRVLLKKNKKVTIIVGDKTANDFYIPESEEFNKVGILPYIYETSLRRFIQSNQKFIDTELLDVCLWQDDGNSFHLKGISSDQKNYLITGHNINPRAWRLDIENGVLIQDSNQYLKDKFDSELEQILRNCKRVNHFEEIETPDDYRIEARKLLKSVKRAKLDSILNRLL